MKGNLQFSILTSWSIFIIFQNPQFHSYYYNSLWFPFFPMLILIIWRFMTSLRSFQFQSFNTKLSFSALKLPEATTPFFILIEQMQKVVQNQVHLYTNSLVCTTHTCFSKEYFWEIRASRPLTLCASNTYHPNLLCLHITYKDDNEVNWQNVF